MSAITFLKEFVRKPTQMGAVTPSGPQLAASMVDASEIRPEHVVVELGAGTGPITRAIAAAHAGPFLALEPHPDLAAILRAEMPAVEVREGWAQDLPAICEDWGHPKVDRIVSGLPWAIWSKDVQDAIFDAVFDVLVEDGRMVTFTYVHSQWLPAGRQLERTLRDRFGTVTRTPISWVNVPPAFVWVCSRG